MKIIRLLTIGNSFARNALTYLEDMADSTGDVRFDIGRANLGGCSLEKHWNLALYTSRHPEYKTYPMNPATDGSSPGGSLQDALTAAPWDIVTLQQVSYNSWRRHTFQPYLGLLQDFALKHAPRARILLHQTWAYRADSPFFPQNGLTQDLMHARIRETYRHYAAELDCSILPAGEAVQRARRTSGRTFSWPEPDFDYHDAEAPALPRQDHSLAVGWTWAIHNSPRGIPELRLDANHLNMHGCYLAGCVWFECLTGQDARAIRFAPENMDADTAAFLRDTAHETCRDNAEG